eukprot:gene12553-6373_t
MGFGYFYDRKVVLEQIKGTGFYVFPLILFGATSYIILYRFLYEHPYWEQRMMRKDNRKLLEESFFTLNSSMNERQKLLQESSLEFCLKKFKKTSLNVDYPTESFEKLFK